MATVYYADNYATPIPSGPDGAILAAPFIFTVSTALVLNDTIKLVQLNMGPSATGSETAANALTAKTGGWILYALRIDIPDLDSGTSLVFELGDSSSATRYVTTTLAGAIGQTAGVISSFGPSIPYAAATAAAGVVAASLPARYFAQDDLILTVQTAPGTGLTGVAIQGYILYQQLGTSPFTATV